MYFWPGMMVADGSGAEKGETSSRHIVGSKPTLSGQNTQLNFAPGGDPISYHSLSLKSLLKQMAG
jgi:hypothetical protein